MLFSCIFLYCAFLQCHSVATADSAAGPRSAIKGCWDRFVLEGTECELISCAWVYTDALEQASLSPEVCTRVINITKVERKKVKTNKINGAHWYLGNM